MDNTPRVTGNVNNSSKVVDYETWNTNTSSWNTETRTWNQMNAILNNTAKVSPSMNNTPKP